MNGQQEQIEEMPLSRIVKYDNRKLYSLDESKYVTLQELKKKIQHGSNVQITRRSEKEGVSGRDVTNEVLSQIISKLELTVDQKLLLIKEN